MKSCPILGIPDISGDIGGEGHSCNEGTTSRCNFDDTVRSFRSLSNWLREMRPDPPPLVVKRTQIAWHAGDDHRRGLRQGRGLSSYSGRVR